MVFQQLWIFMFLLDSWQRSVNSILFSAQSEQYNQAFTLLHIQCVPKSFCNMNILWKWLIISELFNIYLEIIRVLFWKNKPTNQCFRQSPKQRFRVCNQSFLRIKLQDLNNFICMTSFILFPSKLCLSLGFVLPFCG